MDAYTLFFKKSLYEATEEEIIELETHDDPLVNKEAKNYSRPMFEDIQREKREAKSFKGKLVIRTVEKKDFEGLIRLSRRVNWLDDNTGIRSYSLEDLRVTINEGIMFVATTISGFIIAASSMLVGDINGKKCGYESTTQVSKLFRRKGVAEKIFTKRIDWARKNEFTHINTRGLSEDGFKFLKAIERKRKDLEFVINRYGISTISLKY